jgi:hypothetical protein
MSMSTDPWFCLLKDHPKTKKYCQSKYDSMLFPFQGTVKLGDKEQIGVKELFIDYQPFYTINLL